MPPPSQARKTCWLNASSYTTKRCVRPRSLLPSQHPGRDRGSHLGTTLHGHRVVRPNLGASRRAFNPLPKHTALWGEALCLWRFACCARCFRSETHRNTPVRRATRRDRRAIVREARVINYRLRYLADPCGGSHSRVPACAIFREVCAVCMEGVMVGLRRKSGARAEHWLMLRRK